MHFVKMQGLGNDFVLVEGPLSVDRELVAALCDRRRGVGADGILVVTRSDGRIGMEYWNADGSPAEMCGNGLRCVARYAFDRGWTQGRSFSVDTANGSKQTTIDRDGTITVELGEVFTASQARTLEGRRWWEAQVGNPHAVTLVHDVREAPVASVGPSVEAHSSFPSGTNVEFAAVRDRSHIDLRVWERGAGETLACGTGAAATVGVASRLGLIDLPVTVSLPGGEMQVDIDESGAWISGPAEYAFEGEWRR